MAGEPQDDLFTWCGRYPQSPGFKSRDTAAAAALKMVSRAETLRSKCLAVLDERPMTADEVAAVIGESVLAVRPRFSELSAMQRIQDTGQRRLNVSGKKAIVWSRS